MCSLAGTHCALYHSCITVLTDDGRVLAQRYGGVYTNRLQGFGGGRQSSSMLYRIHALRRELRMESGIDVNNPDVYFSQIALVVRPFDAQSGDTCVVQIVKIKSQDLQSNDEGVLTYRGEPLLSRERAAMWVNQRGTEEDGTPIRFQNMSQRGQEAGMFQREHRTHPVIAAVRFGMSSQVSFVDSSLGWRPVEWHTMLMLQRQICMTWNGERAPEAELFIMRVTDVVDEVDDWPFTRCGWWFGGRYFSLGRSGSDYSSDG